MDKKVLREKNGERDGLWIHYDEEKKGLEVIYKEGEISEKDFK